MALSTPPPIELSSLSLSSRLSPEIGTIGSIYLFTALPSLVGDMLSIGKNITVVTHSSMDFFLMKRRDRYYR
jgi:hypothetical protein